MRVQVSSSPGGPHGRLRNSESEFKCALREPGPGGLQPRIAVKTGPPTPPPPSQIMGTQAFVSPNSPVEEPEIRGVGG